MFSNLKISARRAAALATAALVLGGGLTTVASAPALAEPVAGVAAAGKVELSRTDSITVTKPGTVIDKKYVDGAINIRADNVTIRNSFVNYGGYHSIRIFDDVQGTRIENTTVLCGDSTKTNGVVFGDYTAVRVALWGCRNGFMYGDDSPATIIDSTVDGAAVNVGASEPTPEPEPTTPEPEPTREPTPEPEPTREPTPEPEPTREPTPEPEPTREPTPEPEPTQEPDTDQDFPTALTTGVPEGVDLTRTGSLRITEPGTVVDARHIQGTVTIAADDVTIRNSLVQTRTSLYPIKVESGVVGALIENVEVDNQNGTGLGIYFKGAGTVRSADIHSAEDGIRIEADDVTVERSYIHDLHRVPGGHHDSLQIRKGDNITIRGNNFQAYRADTRDPMNAAIQLGSLLGNDPISDLVVKDNLFNGGNFTINAGGSSTVDGAVYSGNRFGRDFRYGVVGNLSSSVSQWDDTNVWHDTGKPVR